MTTIIDNIIFISYLDAGCIAETYLTKRIGSNKLYATKRIDLNLIDQEPCLKKHIENEITILKTINHRNIVKLYKTWYAFKSGRGLVFVVYLLEQLEIVC